MDATTLAAIISSAAFTAGLLQILKTYVPAIGANTRFLPLLSMAVADACGIGAAAVLGNVTWLVAGTVFVGGFMASGFYAATKAVVGPPAETHAP